MGKRELVLVSLFVVLGIVVYQFTAPPPPPGSTDVSVGGILRNIRRGIQGARETASADSTRTVPLDASIQQLRINLPRSSEVTIQGADRADIQLDVHAEARAYEQTEAKATAEALTVNLQPAGEAMVVAGVWPQVKSGPGGVTQVIVTLTVPRRLAVRFEPHLGTVTVSDVASLEMMGSRGETRLHRIAGRVALTHTAGALEIDGAASLKLTARNSRGDIRRVAGAAALDLTGARLTLSDVAGPVEIESRNAELTIAMPATAKAPLRYNGTGGRLRVEGLRIETRIDGRNTDMDVALAAAAPVTIYNTGDMTVTAPPGGYTLDAQATDGSIAVEDSGVTPTEGPESQASGKIRGGGPTLTLRATRGRIDVRKAGGN